MVRIAEYILYRNTVVFRIPRMDEPVARRRDTKSLYDLTRHINYKCGPRKNSRCLYGCLYAIRSKNHKNCFFALKTLRRTNIVTVNYYLHLIFITITYLWSYWYLERPPTETRLWPKLQLFAQSEPFLDLTKNVHYYITGTKPKMSHKFSKGNAVSETKTMTIVFMYSDLQLFLVLFKHAY